MSSGKTIMNREREKRDSTTPIKLSEDTGARHTVCDNQLDCIAVHDALSMTMKSNASPVRKEIRTR